jgi:3'-phosphoadenosine 5'-phosphosulfate sulfotransferase (PAPS reductase)/FAD synthetase
MTPNLKSYHWIVLNSSGGKDSQTMLDVVVEQAELVKLPRSRLVVAHADLGRVEWPGTRELAEEQARHYGLEFIAVTRPQGDLLEHILQRGMFPSPTARYCTSNHLCGEPHNMS